MANRKLLVGMECRTLLLFAAQNQLPLTLTTKNEKNWHLLKANFLACQSKRLILSMPIPENGRPPIEPAPAQQCAVTFKKGYYKFIFTTRTIAQTQHHIDSDLSVPALVILCPSHIEKIQRRAYNRATAPQDPPITITFQKSSNKSSSTQLSPWQPTVVRSGVCAWVTWRTRTWKASSSWSGMGTKRQRNWSFSLRREAVAG